MDENVYLNENIINETSTSTDGTQKEKRVKILIKEVYNNTAACNACRTRKRKCDGKAPCSYCVSKNQECTFAQQRKRGPTKKRKAAAAVDPATRPFTNDAALVRVRHENEILDSVEAANLHAYYWKYVNMIMPISNMAYTMTPVTNAHKVQSYSALAFAAKINGDQFRAKKYITQARTLAGTIFDVASVDSITAMLMLSSYWQLVLDMPLAIHYSTLACSLVKMDPKCVDGKLGAFCKVTLALSDESLSKQQQAVILKDVAKLIVPNNSMNELSKIVNYLTLTADMLEILGLNILFPEADIVSKGFSVVDNVFVSEEERVKILDAIGRLSKAILSIYTDEHKDHVMLLYSVFCPLYQAVTEWRSGHTNEALTYSMTLLNGLEMLKDTDVFGLVADFPHVSMMGNLCKLFLETGVPHLVPRMCKYINKICKLMEPDFDILVPLAEQFSSMCIFEKDARPSVIIEEIAQAPSYRIFAPRSPVQTVPHSSTSPTTTQDDHDHYHIHTIPSTTSSNSGDNVALVMDFNELYSNENQLTIPNAIVSNEIIDQPNDAFGELTMEMVDTLLNNPVLDIPFIV